MILVPCQKSELELPDTVTKISSCAALGNTKLTKVKFSNKLITIGESAFANCSKLKEVQFPNTIKEIEEYAFESCYALKDIFIPASVTSLEQTVFVNCKNIKTFKIDKKNKKYCSSDGEFYNKKKTIFYGVVTNKKSLTLPKSVKTLSFGESACGQNLQKIKVQKGNKYFSVYDNVLYDKKKTEIYFCPSSKKSIILPTTFTQGSTLLACGQNLQKIKVQKGNKYFSVYDNVLYDKKKTGIYFCPSSKKSIILPATFTKDYTLYEGAYQEHLEKIQVKAGNKSFSSYKGVLYNKKKTKIICVPEKIKSITIPKTCISSISPEVRQSIVNNPYVTSIAVEKGNKKFQAKDGILYNKKQTEVLLCTKGKEKVVLPQTVKSIGIRAFSGCKKLKSIIFSNNLEEIQTGAFEYCNSLEYVKLPDRKIEIDAMAFMQCSNLKWIYIPKEARFTEEKPRHIFGGSNKLSDIYYSGSEEEWKKSWSRYGHVFPYDDDIDITDYDINFDEKIFGRLKVHYKEKAPL